MSRCFPYPPPGYVRNGASGEALMESIKLQREKEKARTERRKERKSEKREKKDKKREKKVKGKEKPGEICDGEEKKLKDVKSLKGERSILDSRGEHLRKRLEEEAEQLEKSGLTEEHEQPICSENPCYSSDGTQNSNKRIRLTSPSNGSRNNHGNIIRFRLPLQKHREPDTSLKQQICASYTSERTNSQAQQKYEISHVQQKYEISLVPSKEQTDLLAQQKFKISHVSSQEQTDSRAQQKFEISHIPSQEQCSTSGRTELFAPDGALVSNLFENEMRKTESLYQALIENWVPPLLQIEQTDYDNQQWLFETMSHDRQMAKRFKASNDVTCCGSSSLLPRAHYLPEADTYALPYTIPY